MTTMAIVSTGAFFPDTYVTAEEIAEQSERMELYGEYAQQLVDAGKAFVCYRTPEELDALREKRRAAGNSTALKPSDLMLLEHEVEKRRAAGDPYVIRMMVPEDDGSCAVEDLLRGMVLDIVAHNLDDIPAPPSSLYLRPTLIGTLPNIGAAAAPSTEATLFVLTSPVGDYFTGGARPLKLLVEDQKARSTEQLGSTKTGGNYAAALGPTLAAKAEYGVDQVLFCPNGDVQETGAANFLLISDDEVITKPLDTSFLHGITRGSAERKMLP